MVTKKRSEPPPDEDEAFPRGGRDDLTPLEKRQLTQQAEADYKHEKHTKSSGNKQRKRSKLGQDDAEGEHFALAAASGKVEHVQQLKYRTLSVGMKLLGCVLEVSPEGLMVSLAHGLRGTVSAKDTSDILSQMLDPNSKRGAALRASMPGQQAPSLPQLFSVGQYVRCVIKELPGEDEGKAAAAADDAAADAGAGGKKGSGKHNKRIVLSLKLKALVGNLGPEGLSAAGQVVPAVVKSVEDRGYSLSFGIKGVTGFLPTKDYATYYDPAAFPLLPGSLLEVVVTAAPTTTPSGLIVQTSINLDKVAGGLLHSWDGLNMNCLLPGALVNCKVRQVCSDGVQVSFGGFFHGAIDHFHLGTPVPEADWQKRYQVGQKLQARLLYVDPNSSSKRIGLSCLPHLLNCRMPSPIPAMGQIFDAAVIARVDPSLGLLLQLPMGSSSSGGASAAAAAAAGQECAVGFAHISNLSDDKLSSSEVAKRFKVGGTVRGRVIGFRLIDALVAITLKESVLAQQVFSIKDLYPGQLLNVTVLDQASAGVIVNITDTLKGLVPRLHMTDSGAAATGDKLPSKLKPGKTLPARVLSVNPMMRRVELTLKKGLLGSKLPVLAALKDAEAGMKLHGVVTGVESYGVFVGFYGGLAGLMPKAQLDLLPGQEPADIYSKGQLLRCQVASVDLRRNKLLLKPAVKKSAAAEEAEAAAAAAAAAAADPWGGLTIGTVVDQSAKVQQVLQRSPEEGGGLVELLVTGANGEQVLGHVPAAHLSDHRGAVESLMSALRPGMTLPGPLLVLQQRRLRLEGSVGRWQLEEGDQAADGSKGAAGAAAAAADGSKAVPATPMLLLSRKPSLVAAAAAGQLPAAPSEVKQGEVLPGYVASVTRDAVFVRFLGRCTGRAGISQLADTFVTDPARHFVVGQTVMAAVVAIDESGKFTVSLKPSVAGSYEGKFLAGLLRDLELVGQLQQAAEAAAEGSAAGAADAQVTSNDTPLFTPGRVLNARVNELRSYGAVMDLEDDDDIVGLVVPEHGGGPDAAQLEGTGPIKTCVLDASKSQGIIELSLRPELTGMQQQQQQEGKKHSKKAAAAAAGDQQQHHHQKAGSEVQVMVQLIKDHYVVVSLLPQQQQQHEKGKKKAGAAAAAGEQQQQQPQQPQVHAGIGFLARCDINSQGSAGMEGRRFERGQVLSARVFAAPAADNGQRLLMELTQPLQLSASKAAPGKAGSSKSGAAGGGLVAATVLAVHEIELEVAWGKAGSTAHLHISELQERLTQPPKQNPLSGFKVQQQLTAAWLGHVKGLGNKRGKEPQLSLRPSAVAAAKQGGDKAAKVGPVLGPKDLNPGLKVVGWVCGFSPDSLWLSLAPEVKGRVYILESGDSPEQLAVGFEDRFSIGQGLAAVVLGLDPKHHTLDLSIRADRLAAAVTDPAAAAGRGASTNDVILPEGGTLVMGRVVSVSGSGVVVQLGPKLQGLVALTDIHDSWVGNALTGLAAGGYVRARVLAAAAAAAAAPLVDSKGRVLLSLRPSMGGSIAGGPAAAAAAANGMAAAAAEEVAVASLKPGSKVQGYVRSVSNKGLFVVLDRHHDARVKLSQLSDGYVEDPAAAFPVGCKIEGRVLAVEHTKPQPVPAAAAAAAAAAGGGGSSSSSSQAVQLVDDGVRVELSLRSGEGMGQLRTLEDIQEGKLTGGKVRKVERYGVFVELNRSRVSGLVHISQIGKGFVKDLASHYSPGQAVTVRVLSVDREKNKVNLSMKPELLVADDDENMEDEQAAAAAAGGSKRQRKAAAAVAADDFDDEMLEAAELEGGSSSEEEEEEEEMEEDEEAEQGGSSSSGDDEEEGEDVDMDDMELLSEDEDDEGSEDEQAGSSEDDEDDGVMPGQSLHNLLLPGLAGPSAAAAAAAAAAGSDWGELQLEDGGAAADAAAAAAANGTSGELTRAQKKRLKQQKEDEIRAAERARLEGKQAPESVTSYEQQLMASPNSSFIWIKFMAFQLKLGEVAAARAVAERALSTIAMTEEAEKFNVWMALINLENAYGGDKAEEAVMTVFKRAVQYVEPKKLYLALLGVLARSGRQQLASEVWRTATKKFNSSCKVWLGAFEFALQQANAAAAAEDEEAAAAAAGQGGGSSSGVAAAAAAAAAPRAVLERALKSLPRHKHIKALTRAALTEFRTGCPERGRSILEGVVSNNPKRIDLWSLYIDQEVKAGDPARVRSLLTRATSLSLPPKKMKLLFRRWLEYEQAHGSAADVAAVKQRAVEYMESQALGAVPAAAGGAAV